MTQKSSREKAPVAMINLETMISTLEPIRELIEEAKHHPIRLFYQICTLSRETGSAVSDHSLSRTPYLSDVALKALIAGELIETTDPGHHAMYAYLPTKKGLKIFQSLELEKSKLDHPKK